MFNNFINVVLFRSDWIQSEIICISFSSKFSSNSLYSHISNIFLISSLTSFYSLSQIYFIFYIFLRLVPVFLSFPFFLIFSMLFLILLPAELIHSRPMSVFLLFSNTLCQNFLFESGKTSYIFSYAFPLDSPRVMPVAIRWATLRGSGMLLLIEVRRMIFSTFFAPIPAF